MTWTVLHELPPPYDETAALGQGMSPSPAQINRVVAVYVFSDGVREREVALTAFQADRAAALAIPPQEFARGLLVFDSAVAA